jgi:hypothetical protein
MHKRTPQLAKVVQRPLRSMGSETSTVLHHDGRGDGARADRQTEEGTATRESFAGKTSPERWPGEREMPPTMTAEEHSLRAFG